MKHPRLMWRVRHSLSIPAVILVVSLSVPVPAATPVQDWTTPAMGPLGGRNLHAPHLPWFSFPADTAGALESGTVRIRTGLSYLNEFSSYPFDPEDYTLDADGRLTESDQLELIAADYESAVLELGLDWQIDPRWRLSADWRLHARWAGFLDPVIEWWHDALGASNAGREYFDRNRAYWNIEWAAGAPAAGSGVTVAPGDLDLRAVWSFLDRPRFDLGAGAAFKLPVGRVSGGFGSGYPDIGLELLTDWTPWRRWAFHLGTGIILPIGGEGRAVLQFIPVVEFRAAERLSILLQMNIQGAPLPGGEMYVHPYFGTVGMFSLPQTNLKLGLKGRREGFGWELCFEEDPLTWEGADILLRFGASWDIAGRRSSGGRQF